MDHRLLRIACLILQLPFHGLLRLIHIGEGTVQGIISQKGMAYRRIVMDECLTIKNKFGDDKQIRMEVVAYPPDKRGVIWIICGKVY